ncbi:hypothetical protein [Aquirhabdus sp.]|uniref:hypothetical protein n=1 Tax=Aquirhabdus sp. TaxID=2824160 RepID=UPI00396CD2B5
MHGDLSDYDKIQLAHFANDEPPEDDMISSKPAEIEPEEDDCDDDLYSAPSSLANGNSRCPDGFLGNIDKVVIGWSEPF